jgi:hypothetical protein
MEYVYCAVRTESLNIIQYLVQIDINCVPTKYVIAQIHQLSVLNASFIALHS